MSHVALRITLLGRTDLFRSLSEVDRGAVAGQMREVTYEPGKLIFGRGDPGEEMHLVVEGRVLSVLSAEGKVLSFAHAGRGDIFGEIATLDGGTPNCRCHCSHGRYHSDVGALLV